MAIEPRNPAGVFPQLNIMIVDHLFGAFPRVVFICAVEIDSFDVMAVAANKICSIVRHNGTPLLGGSMQHSLSPITAEGLAVMETVCSGFVFRTRPDTPTIPWMQLTSTFAPCSTSFGRGTCPAARQLATKHAADTETRPPAWSERGRKAERRTGTSSMSVITGPNRK
jgi:hypothetical protein